MPTMTRDALSPIIKRGQEILVYYPDKPVMRTKIKSRSFTAEGLTLKWEKYGKSNSTFIPFSDWTVKRQKTSEIVFNKIPGTLPSSKTSLIMIKPK